MLEEMGGQLRGTLTRSWSLSLFETGEAPGLSNFSMKEPSEEAAGLPAYSIDGYLSKLLEK